MKYILLLFFILSPFSSLSLESPIEEVVTVIQKVPPFHDLSHKIRPPPIVTYKGNEVEITKKSLRSSYLPEWIKKHLLYPQVLVTLSVSDSINEKQVKKVEWSFFKGHYLPLHQKFPIEIKKLNVLAWRSFPIQVKISFKDNSNSINKFWVRIED